MRWSPPTVLVVRTLGVACAAVLAATPLPAPWNALTTAAILGLATLAHQWRATAWMAAATRSILRLADGDHEARVPDSGPAETRSFAVALNRAAAVSARREQARTVALDEAARQRDRLASIFTASSDGLLLYDANRSVVAANPRVGELLGFTDEQLSTRSVLDLMADLQARCADPDHYRERIDQHFAAPTRSHEDVLIVERPRRRVLKRFSSPVWHSGEVAGRVFTYTDITAEWDLDHMKSEFVAHASHELRTPLTSVHAALQLALSGSASAMDSEDREMLEISLASTERLVRLVNDLLDLSKIEAGRMPFDRTDVDIAELLVQVVRTLESLAAERGITLTVRTATPLVALADRDQVWRVVSNLASNALKYAPSGSTVTVTSEAGPEFVEIGVIDEGPGIPADHLGRLFQPFSRVGAQERQTTGGTGLGLAISRAIVEQHGGKLWWEPNHPRGSRFLVRLPRPPATHGDKAPEAVPLERQVA